MKDQFDVVIVGGGIAGLAVFHRLSANYKVCLLEAKTLFSGASGGSLRIMHSGLRYLKSGRVDLFLESHQCQRYLRDNYPGAVETMKFVAQVPLPLAKMIRAGVEVSDTFLSVPNPMSWDEVLLVAPHVLTSQLSVGSCGSRILERSPVVEIAGGGVFSVMYRDVAVGGIKSEVCGKVVINCAGAAVTNIDCSRLQVSQSITARRPKFVRAWNVITSVPYKGPIFAVNGAERMVVGTPRAGELVIGTGYGESLNGTWYVSHEERSALLKEFGLTLGAFKGVEGGMLAVKPVAGIKFLGSDLVNVDGNYAEVFAAKFVTFSALSRKVSNWVHSRIPLR